MDGRPVRDLAAWERAGLADDEAVLWKQAGFTPEEASRWFDAFLLGAEPALLEGEPATMVAKAAEYRSAGLTADDFECLQLTGADLGCLRAEYHGDWTSVSRTFRPWARAGFAPREAVAWMRAGVVAPEVADRWRLVGLNHSVAREWESTLGCDMDEEGLPLEVRIWKSLGFSPAQAAEWRSEGFAPEEAKVLRRQDAGPDSAVPGSTWQPKGLRGGPGFDASWECLDGRHRDCEARKKCTCACHCWHNGREGDPDLQMRVTATRQPRFQLDTRPTRPCLLGSHDNCTRWRRCECHCHCWHTSLLRVRVGRLESSRKSGVMSEYEYVAAMRAIFSKR